MSESTQHKTRRKWLCGIALVLVVYVFSIGPAVAMMTDSQWNTLYPEYYGLVEAFYAPVGLIGNSNDTLRSFFSAYIDFFVQRF